MLQVRKPNCSACEHHHFYSGMFAQRSKGITLHMGDQYCDAGKKYRLLKKRTVSNGVPADCPRLREVPLLRVYCYKDSAAMAFATIRSQCISPSAHSYAMRYQSDSPITAWALCEELEQGMNPVDALLDLGEVLEIDDGFRPYFFQKTADGLLNCLFDRDVALKNNLMRDTP